MNQTIARELMKEINQKREQLIAIREEVEDLLDYLEVLEARTKDKNKPLLLKASPSEPSLLSTPVDMPSPKSSVSPINTLTLPGPS